MTINHLRTLWTASGIILVFYAFNAFLENRGLNAIFDVELLDDRPRLESLFAIPICSLLLIIISRIGRAHSNLQPDVSWHSRLPIVWLDGLDTGSPEGKRYQLACLVLFVILPAVLLVHFCMQLMGASVSLASGGDLLAPWEAVSWQSLWNERYVIGEIAPDRSGVINGVDWFPLIEPILFGALVIWAWSEVIRMLYSVFQNR